MGGNTLTTEQQAIADHAGGHAKIIAVAGSGKTTALLHYVKNRLDAGISPERLLVLMYNRSAREDFDRRMRHLADGPIPSVHTFHSMGYRLYQRMIANDHIAAANLTLSPNPLFNCRSGRRLRNVPPPTSWRKSVRVSNRRSKLQNFLLTTPRPFYPGTSAHFRS
ncbi:UvrD-helicase domain-containing protein [Microbulbifer sp. MLAF003]|uniref:UvrD-helicase domain-containing protein n=1 Tax=Microbulbifer sp. MLAF003 TaxID=3032582 RepID=UPI0024AE37FD|nr:UvrD-helicase domain-containing protein [Microbulbifer sp. MLAF003]WHI52806.1 UvrD-helicase domain-containing protein [Microbulbifer sp. MLAF003]